MRSKRPSLLSTLMQRLRKNRSVSRADAPISKYQAVAIYRGVNACEMARRFCEHRFLMRDAPALPLRECTMPLCCECRYLKFKDRRASQRRSTDFGTATRGYGFKERRLLRGRRLAD